MRGSAHVGMPVCGAILLPPPPPFETPAPPPFPLGASAVDFCGLSQGAAAGMPAEYFEHTDGRTSRASYTGRTQVEERQFGFALSEMSRMCACHDVAVLVLDEPHDSF